MIKRKVVLFSDINKIRNFVNEAEKTPFSIDIQDGRYLIDGKSILGILSMNLSRPKLLLMNGEEKEVEDFLTRVGRYVYLMPKEE